VRTTVEFKNGASEMVLDVVPFFDLEESKTYTLVNKDMIVITEELPIADIKRIVIEFDE